MDISLLNLFSLLFGLLAWGLPFIAMSYLKGKKYKRVLNISILSISLTAVSIYFQFLYTNYLVKKSDWSALLDTNDFITLACTVLIGITFILNFINILAIKLKKINYSIGYQGMTYTVNNLKIKLLNTAYQDENDSSLVLYMLFNDKKILLMGDASKTVEQDLIDKYDLPNIDYLKVGHHGSKTSTSSNFIDVVNPKYSIISVGKNNLYNHPNAEVLANLSNTKIYRTDDNGSILFKFKKNKVIIKTSPS